MCKTVAWLVKKLADVRLLCKVQGKVASKLAKAKPTLMYLKQLGRFASSHSNIKLLRVCKPVDKVANKLAKLRHICSYNS